MKSKSKNFNFFLKVENKQETKFKELSSPELKNLDSKKTSKNYIRGHSQSLYYFLKQESSLIDQRYLGASKQKNTSTMHTLEAIIKNLQEKIKFLEAEMDKLQSMEKEDNFLAQTFYVNFLEEKIRRLEQVAGPIKYEKIFNHA